MANRKRIKHILESADKFGLKVMRPKHIQRFLPDVSEYRVFVNLFGREVQGIGIDHDEDTAFLKGFSEAVERAFCIELNIPSTGVAAHFSEALAKESAKNELIERDAFFTKYLLGRGGIKQAETSLLGLIDKSLIRHGIVEIFDISNSSEIATYLTVSKLPNDGIVIGLGCSQDKKQAIEKALFESISRLTYFSDYGKERNDKVDDNLLTNIESNEFLSSRLYLNSKETTIIDSELDRLEYSISYTEIGDLNQVIPDLDLIVVRAESSDLQMMYKGKTKESTVNFKRLNHLSQSLLSFESLEQRLHPVG